MWESLRREGIDLELPVPLHRNVYLGCGQNVLQPDLEMIANKRDMVYRIYQSKDYGKPTSPAGGPSEGSFYL